MTKRPRGVSKRVTEDLDQRDLAVRRLGATPTERLRWVVEVFARRDLSLARPEELVAWGYDLRSLAPPVGTLTRSPHAPLPIPTLKQIHTSVNAGLRRLLSTKRPDQHGLERGWELPRPKSARLVNYDGVILRVQESRNEFDSILAALAELILRAGNDLRACPECGRPFVRTGRRGLRIFCGERCSMRVRNRNRRTSR